MSSRLTVITMPVSKYNCVIVRPTASPAVPPPLVTAKHRMVVKFDDIRQPEQSIGGYGAGPYVKFYFGGGLKIRGGEK